MMINMNLLRIQMTPNGFLSGDRQAVTPFEARIPRMLLHTSFRGVEPSLCGVTNDKANNKLGPDTLDSFKQLLAPKFLVRSWKSWNSRGL